MNEGKGLKN